MDEKEAKVIDYYDLEGMALTNMLNKAKLIICDKNKAKIQAITKENELVETPCIEEKAARRSMAIVSLYIKWSKDIVSKEKAKGISLWDK